MMEKVSHEITNNKKLNSFNFGDMCCVGWFNTIQEAKFAVENYENLRNDIYNYVIIEQIELGLFQTDIDRYLYKWNTELNKYEEVYNPELKLLEYVSNFSMG